MSLTKITHNKIVYSEKEIKKSAKAGGKTGKIFKKKENDKV